MKILAVSGSLQSRSSNTAVLTAAIELAPPGMTIEVFDGLEALPAFNPDRDVEPPAPAVARWREALRSAEGVVIASPEYAHGMPGALKNALDWVVGSGELVNKPLVLVTASTGSTGGVRAQVQLVQVLSAMNVPVFETFTIPLARTKIDAEGRLTDAATLRRLGDALTALANQIAP